MSIDNNSGPRPGPAVARPAETAKPSTWRNPFVWLIVALPCSAVVASVVTAVIAVNGADPIVSAREPGKVVEKVDPMLPAQKARNRAAEARIGAAETP